MKPMINLPNALTASRILLTPVFLVLILSHDLYQQSLALAVFVLASLTDLYDGRVARRSGGITKFGRFVDPLADKILVSSALIAFVILGLIEIWLVVVILAREVVITTLRSYAIYQGKQVVTSKLAKWKTTLQLIVVLIILVFINVRTALTRFEPEPAPLGSWSYRVLNGLMAVVALITVLSGIRYLSDNDRYHKASVSTPLSAGGEGRIVDSG